MVLVFALQWQSKSGICQKVGFWSRLARLAHVSLRRWLPYKDAVIPIFYSITLVTLYSPSETALTDVFS